MRFPIKIIAYVILIIAVIGSGSILTYFIGNYYHAFNVQMDPVNAIFFTVTTLSTVGYGDMVPVTYLGKEFVIVLIIFGFGIFIGALSLISGEVMKERMDKLSGRLSGLEKKFLKNHIVLIGTDSVNLVLAENLKKINRNFIIITSDETESEKLKELNYRVFNADITSEEEMKKFLLDKASEIIIDVSNSSILLYTFLIVSSLSKEADKIIIVHSPEAEKRFVDLNLPSNCTILNPSSLVAVSIINNLKYKG